MLNQRIKYIYDESSCQYVEYRPSLAQRLVNASSILSGIILFGLVFGYFLKDYFQGNELQKLKKENKELLAHYDILTKRLDESNDVLLGLQDRDDDIYRVIFEAEPIPSTVRQAGYGGIDHYKGLLEQGLEKTDLLLTAYRKVDQLRKQLYIQTKSYDEVVGLIRNKEQLLNSTPAIMPVKLNDCKVSSGFGVRTDPIYKTLKFHAGLDFSARVGTDVHASAQGKVISAGRPKGYSGYGIIVEIDHGYGYRTLYAHLNRTKVRVGQRVKRGDIIGEVGNTGKSTGPHLHYEVHKNGKKLDPINFIFNDISPEQYEQMLIEASAPTQTLD